MDVVPADWYRTFFSGLIVDMWLGSTPPEQTKQEADFLEAVLQVQPPARLLDVPCGGGRHCRALAERGYRMTGVDLSTGFLEAARAQPGPHATPIAWEQRDMRDLPWAASFDGAYCFGNSFGYLEDDANADFLRAVAGVLKPGARFALETGYVLEALLPALQQRAWYPVGELLMLAERTYDPRQARLLVEYTLIRGGTVEKHAMSARMHSCREVVRLLEAAGFTDVETYGSLDREPFRLGSQRLLAVGRKGV